MYFFIFMTKLTYFLDPTVYIEIIFLYRNNDLINLIFYISKQFIKYFIQNINIEYILYNL